MESIIIFTGRILFGGYFIFNAYNHFKNREMMSGYAKSKGIPLPKLSVILTGLLLLTGGAAVLLDYFEKPGLVSLVIFLVPVTFLMHAFWKIQDPMAKMGEMINFMKNLALLGAVLLLLAR
jgi:putative oxidoreductase